MENVFKQEKMGAGLIIPYQPNTESNVTSHLFHTVYINITVYVFIWFSQQEKTEAIRRTNSGNRTEYSQDSQVFWYLNPLAMWFSPHMPSYFQSWNGLTFHQFRHFENIFLINLKKAHLSQALRRGERQHNTTETYCWFYSS